MPMSEENSSPQQRPCSMCGALFEPTIRTSRCPVCRNLATQEWLAQKDGRSESPNQKHLRLLRETGRRF